MKARRKIVAINLNKIERRKEKLFLHLFHIHPPCHKFLKRLDTELELTFDLLARRNIKIEIDSINKNIRTCSLETMKRTIIIDQAEKLNVQLQKCYCNACRTFGFDMSVCTCNLCCEYKQDQQKIKNEIERNTCVKRKCMQLRNNYAVLKMSS